MERLRTVLNLLNMVEVAKEAKISYNILANFKKGKKEYLTNEEYIAVVTAIRNLTSL